VAAYPRPIPEADFEGCHGPLSYVAEGAQDARLVTPEP